MLSTMQLEPESAKPEWDQNIKCSCVCRLRNNLPTGYTLTYDRHVFIVGGLVTKEFRQGGILSGNDEYWACGQSTWMQGNIGAVAYTVHEPPADGGKGEAAAEPVAEVVVMWNFPYIGDDQVRSSCPGAIATMVAGKIPTKCVPPTGGHPNRCHWPLCWRAGPAGQWRGPADGCIPEGHFQRCCPLSQLPILRNAGSCLLLGQSAA